MAVPRKERRSSARPRRLRIAAIAQRPAVAAAIAWVAGMAVALTVWQFVGQQTLLAEHGRFEHRATRLTRDTQRDLSHCADLLRSARGGLVAPPGLAPDAWRAYVDRLDFAGTTSAVHALVYADVKPGALAHLPDYDSEPGGDDVADSSPPIRHTSTLDFGGEPLALVYTTSEHTLRAAAGDADPVVLILGLAAAVLLAAVAYLVALERAGAARANREDPNRSTLNAARMMGIIRSSMEAIITIDENQRVVIFNPMAEQLFGCPAMDAIGSPLSRFIPERFRAAHARHVDQFGVTGVSDRQMGRQRVLFGLRANGEEFPIEASISQIRDATGKLYTVMLRDVTERVKADNAQKRSREELRELSANLQNVREEEKNRIARELHDDLGQQLTALKMDLSSVEMALAADPALRPELLQQLHGMRRLIDATVASVRRIAADLRPVMLDDLGLIPAIEWLASDFTSRYGIAVERRIETGETRFTRDGATALFRIVQEALTNVAKHADATLVMLTMGIGDASCVLRIVDNGRGAGEHDPRAEKSFGLLGIRERVHMLGGSVEIDTANGKGFAITVTFPLQAIKLEEAHP